MKERETAEQYVKILTLEKRIENLTDDCIMLEAENVFLVSIYKDLL